MKAPGKSSVTDQSYELVKLTNDAFSIHSRADRETFHPVAGPVAEAEALYVEQLKLRKRMAEAGREFVIWDVGLGAGGNVCTALRSLSELSGQVRIVSFDRTIEALRFAAAHAEQLGFPLGFEGSFHELIEERRSVFHCGALDVEWEVRLGEFPEWIQGAAETRDRVAAPDAIFFDAFSPARNPEMWTLPLFHHLFRGLDPERPCSLATFSRSTMARVTLLLAGFFVGAGVNVAGKEETTIAANELGAIERPLDHTWLNRVKKSRSAQPLLEGVYQQLPLSVEDWQRLRMHRQFNGG